MDATKLYLHFSRFAGDIVLCSNILLFIAVSLSIVVSYFFHKKKITLTSDMMYITLLSQLLCHKYFNQQITVIIKVIMCYLLWISYRKSQYALSSVDNSYCKSQYALSSVHNSSCKSQYVLSSVDKRICKIQ